MTDTFETMGGVTTFAYLIEILNINDPDKVYKYRLPVSNEKQTDPITFIAEVFNLVNHDP